MSSIEEILRHVSGKLKISYDPSWVQSLNQNGYDSPDSLSEISQSDWLEIGLPLRVYKKLCSEGHISKKKSSSKPKSKPQSEHDEKLLALGEKLFEEFDSDKSGEMDSFELRYCLERLNIRIDHENSLLLLQRVDKNNDGKIQKDEFLDMLALVQEIKQTFDELDTDKSETINTKELLQLFQQMKINLPNPVAKEFMKIFDEDNSGNIDYQEFFNLILYLRELQYQYNQAVEKNPNSIVQTILGHQKSRHKVAKEFIKTNPKPSFEDVIKLILEIEFSGNRKKAPKVTTVRKTGERKEKPPTKPKTISSEKKKESQEIQAKADPLPQIADKFEDPEFPPSEKFLPEAAHSKVLGWKRIHELSSNPQLFIAGVEEGDVVQGALGDCWFVSALSVVATSGTSFIEDCFVEKNMEAGLYRIKFFKDGEWKIVQIDDRIPCGMSGKPLFGKCKSPDEFWVPLIEKAYAKLHGGYQELEGGSISDGLKDLTGEAVQTFHLEDSHSPFANDDELLWKTLLRNIKESFLMGCAFSSPVAKAEEATAQGLLLNHAYGIIDCQEVQGHRLIRIRNPWGEHEWLGKWSDGSSEWTPELKKHFNFEFGDDGTFFMCFEDFIQQFNRIQVLLLMTDDVGEIWQKYPFNDSWGPETSGGCLNNPTWSKNPQYSLEVQQKSTVFVSLGQPDLRMKKRKDDNYPALGMFVFKTSDTKFKALSCNSSQLVVQSTFVTSRDVSVEFQALPGEKYVVVPCYFQPQVHNPFNLTFYTQKKATISPITQEMKSNSISGKWDEEHSGGCTNHSTWRENPQYLLKSSEKAKVILSLEQEIKGDADPLTIGLYLFRSPGGYPVLNPKSLVSKPRFSNVPKSTLDVDLEANVEYVVMPSTFDPNHFTDFKLSVFLADESSRADIQILDIKPWTKKVHLESKWTKDSGGCMNHKSWKENPKFLIEFNGKSSEQDFPELNILLSVPSGEHAIGGHLFKSDASGNLQQIQGNVDFIKGHSSLGSFTLPKVDCHFVFFPCTFEPGKKANFLLDIYSTANFTAKEL